MIQDALTTLAEAQAFTVDAVTNSYDLGTSTPFRDVGTGEPLTVKIMIDVAAAGGGLYEFQLIQSANANLSSPDVIASIFPLQASMVVGTILDMPIPVGRLNKRYIGVAFNSVSGTTSVTATIWVDRQSFGQSWLAYQKSYTIT